ncbi:two-component system response regulator CpxR [Azospirillum lipoferum]|uniref:Response regulator n=1 Tax=Azospirillum lipoferum TaxID=193 RepID=A0A5A9GRV2_AZOLI|nr:MULTISPECIES: response regulator [Azospirillum]KAA0596049.1 response regulator [Azospirillum lipoferum]MCP1610978.1 two-component system response regulator CpxR [Azospirillum lipoferum]MDW5533889.1 response regulator [Azospirillum sp. NL1]
MIKVLLVDDDVDLTAMLVEYLAQENFEGHAVHNGEDGVAAALGGGYAIVVLDVMMPRLSGIETLRRIRQSSRVPVLMLTARGDNIDRITGLDLGADDYVPKPCTPGELVARLRAILRRTGPQPALAMAAATVEAGPLLLCPGSRTATLEGRTLDLTGTEFNLLEVLARRAGHLISKQDLSQRALGRPLSPFDRRIDVHISSIRQKLGTRGDGRSWIQTVRGMGYQLVVD